MSRARITITFHEAREKRRKMHKNRFGHWLMEKFHLVLLSQARLQLHPDIRNSQSDDVVQEVYTVTWQMLPKTSGQDSGEFIYWLFQILSNVCRATNRKYLKAKAATLEPWDSPYTSHESVVDLDLPRVFPIARNILSEEEYELIIQRYVAKESMAAYAKRKQLNENTVRSNHKRALDKLRESGLLAHFVSVTPVLIHFLEGMTKF